MYEGTARNYKTGETATVRLTDDEAAYAVYDSVTRCSGECECPIEGDGTCPEGWPSVLIAIGVM